MLAHAAEARALPQFPAALCWRINHLQAYAKFRVPLGDTVQPIAIVGAGLIGSELANDLALAGHQITLLDAQTRPFASCLSEAQSQQLLNAWQPLPIRFIGGVEVRVVSYDSPSAWGEKHIFTQCGQVFTVDHIVMAAGLQTPNRLAIRAGLKWTTGIEIHPATLATCVEGI